MRVSIPYDVGPDCFPSGKPFRNAFSRSRTEPCDHRWQRLPIVDFSVTYMCRGCETALQVGLGTPGLSLGDRDRLFEVQYGGRVIGAPAPLSLLEIAERVEEQTGVRLAILDADEDED